MKVIKNGFIVGNDVYGEVRNSLYEDDKYGRQGVIINDDGSYTQYDFRGLDSMFDRPYKEKTIVKLTWWQKLKNKFK